MKALIQRVSHARVTVDKQCIADIGQGLLVLLGVERHDDDALVVKMAERLLHYRVFADEAGKMNASLKDINGELLLVSQFTLAADTRKGLRPGFSGAASPAEAERLYEALLVALRERHARIACGRFAADMKVELLNDGPVTFLLEV